MMDKALPYDKTSPDSILAYARQLLGKTLRQCHPEITMEGKGKGELGQCVEKYHFYYKNNSNSEPDFMDAGLELKCTGLKTLKDGSMVSKGRLVLNIIDYLAEANKSFNNSSFSRKNALLLLMFYLHKKGVSRIDLFFKIVRLWKIPEEDRKIFVDDWNVIHEKIVRGLAHTISEGDTLYLAACVKGSKGGMNKRAQPNTTTLADQRAYSIKSSYVNQIILDSLCHPEMIDQITMTQRQYIRIRKKAEQMGSIVKSLGDYQGTETFEQLVQRQFSRFFGLRIAQIEKLFNVSVSESPKSASYSVCRAILGVKQQKIAEFEKAGLRLKTIRLEPSGNLKESMSFQNIKYCEIVDEDKWEDSDWYDTIARHRFFFIVFRKNKNGIAKDAVLEKVFFWAMPTSDIEMAEIVWKDTRDKVKKGDYEHFMTLRSGNPVCHIRPKGKNSHELMRTPQGGMAHKFCYWLNRAYVLNIVNKHKANGTSL